MQSRLVHWNAFLTIYLIILKANSVISSNGHIIGIILIGKYHHQHETPQASIRCLKIATHIICTRRFLFALIIAHKTIAHKTIASLGQPLFKDKQDLIGKTIKKIILES